MPAIVKLLMRQALGLGDGTTLSVVDDMDRKSPVIIEMTISIGVRMACPVMTSPIAKNNTWRVLAMIDRNV